MNKLFQILGLILVVMILSAMLLPMLSVESTSAASDAVSSLSVAFFVLRLSLGVALWWFWNPIVVWLMTDREGIRGSDKAIEVYQSQRSRLAILMIAVEVLLIQGLFASLLRWVIT